MAEKKAKPGKPPKARQVHDYTIMDLIETADAALRDAMLVAVQSEENAMRLHILSEAIGAVADAGFEFEEKA